MAQAGAEDAERAISGAERAFDDGRGAWPRTNATDRGRVIARVATLLRERAEELARTEARDAGHPITDARWEAEAAAATFEYYAGAANKHFGQVVPVQDPGLDVVMREPVGPAALIVPWNFPLLIACWKVAPALACGNTVVLKPATLTPLTALLLGEMLVEAGVPAGSAVTVLPGPGARDRRGAGVRPARRQDLLHRLDRHRRARSCSASAGDITRVSLELGGKSANVVFADADLERAAADAPMSVFANAGQDCCARSRILVERPVYDEFVERLRRGTARRSPSATRSTRPPRWDR